MVFWTALFVVLVWGTLAGAFARSLLRVWREPVFPYPVVIIESDDWGAGTATQADALRRIAAILLAVRDSRGRPATMTLGLVLAIADRDAMRAKADGRYLRADLSQERHADTLAAIKEGVAAGVFAPMMHGLEHYWPEALMSAAKYDAQVRQWLDDNNADTELLPDALQSRWIDGSVLPSQALPIAAIQQAVAEETALFTRIFGRPPRVAVPTTFVWNDAVEQTLGQNGVEFLVTPGRRWEGRDGRSKITGGSLTMVNGERGLGGITYLVRDVYFEPARGHTSGQLLAAVRERTWLGRPSLVETHRFNFMGPAAEPSFIALAEGLNTLRQAVPDMKFMSSEDLGKALVSRDPQMVEVRALARCAICVRRALTIPRFGKLARLTGLAAVLAMASTVCQAMVGPKA